jgi:hypothetical protein
MTYLPGVGPQVLLKTIQCPKVQTLPFVAVHDGAVAAVAGTAPEHTRPITAKNADAARSFFMALISRGDSAGTEHRTSDTNPDGAYPGTPVRSAQSMTMTSSPFR